MHQMPTMLLQQGEVKTLAGATYAASQEPIAITRERVLVAEDFVSMCYTDEATGEVLNYSLFVPKNYNPQVAYPMVVYIPGPSAPGTQISAALTQGNGATAWATDEWQAEHPCIVFVPQFASVQSSDGTEAQPNVQLCVTLVDTITSLCNVDRTRIYAASQSRGCATAMAMMAARQELFAAAILADAQADQSTITALSKHNLWVFASATDGSDEAWKAAGAQVSDQQWLPGDTDETRFEAVKRAIAAGGNVHVSLVGGDARRNSASRIAFSIPALKEWLFDQHR
jgi:predicted peptidase